MADDELLPRARATRRSAWPHGAGGVPALLFAANPQPMWVYDLETLCFLEVNDAAVDHFGHPRAELLAMSVEQIRQAEYHASLPASVPGHSSTARHSGIERHRIAGGALLEVEVTSQLLEWEGRAAALVVARDVTEIRRPVSRLEWRRAPLAVTGALERRGSEMVPRTGTGDGVASGTHGHETQRRRYA